MGLKNKSAKDGPIENIIKWNKKWSEIEWEDNMKENQL